MKSRKRGLTYVPNVIARSPLGTTKQSSLNTQPKYNLVRGFTLVELLVVIVIITFFLSLAAALVPSIDRAEESAKRALCANGLRQIGAAIAVYADSSDGYLPWYGGNDPAFKDKKFRCSPPSADPSRPCPSDDEIHPFNAYRMDPAKWRDDKGNPRAFRLGCLYAGGVIKEPKIFYCPSEQDPLYKYESYTNPTPPNTSTEWGTLPQWINTSVSGVPGFGNQYVRTGYTYYPTNTVAPMGIPMAGWVAPLYTPRKFDQMDPNIPYLTDRIWKRTGDDLDNNKPKPISHRQGTVYGANALFKDGHVYFCDNQAVFNSTVYDIFEKTQIDYRIFFYTTFKAIGNCSRGQPPF